MISELYPCLNRTCHFEQVSPADHSGVVEAPPNTRPSLSNIHIWRYSENSVEMNELEQRRKNFLQCFGFSGESMKTRLENAPTVGSLLLAMVGPAPYSCLSIYHLRGMFLESLSFDPVASICVFTAVPVLWNNLLHSAPARTFQYEMWLQ